MSEILINKLRENIGREATIFLENKFRFFGKIKNVDDSYVEIFDYHSSAIKILKLNTIIDCEIKEEKEVEE